MRYALVIALVVVLLMAATLVAVSVLMPRSGPYPATGPVAPGAPGSTASLDRPSSLGTDIAAAATENTTVHPPFGLVATVPLRGNPTSPIYDSANGEVYFLNSNNISVLNGTTLMANLSISNPPISMTFDPDNGFVYVMGVVPYSADEGVVEVISDGRQIATISTGLGPSGLFDPHNGYVYVASGNVTNPLGQSSLVTVVNGTSVLASITVGQYASLLTCDGQTGDVYVASGGDVYGTGGGGNMTVIDGTAVVGTVPLGYMPVAAVYDGWNGDVYVSSSYSESLVLMHGTALVGTIALTGVPSFCGPWLPSPAVCTFSPVDPRSGDFYVMLGNNISIIQNTSVLATLPVTCCTAGALYDLVRGAAEVMSSGCPGMVACSEADVVQLFNGTQRSATVSLGVSGYPTGTAYDPASGDTYVTTWAGCLVSSCGPATQKPGYVVVLGSPSAPSSNTGSSAVTYVVIAGVGGMLVLAVVAWVLWSRRRPSSSR